MFIKSKYRFSVLLSLLVIILTALLIFLVQSSSAYVIVWTCCDLSSVPLQFSVIIDWIAVMFSLHVMTISFSVFWFACFYMAADQFFQRFIWLLLLFVGSMNILIFSCSFFTLLLGWDALGITSFALIVYYSSAASGGAGFLTLLINRLGDVIIIGTFFLFLQHGSLSTSFIPTPSCSLVILLTVAALTKSAQYPFCSWLPAAMAAPTPVSALVHSSTLVTAGVYLIIRMSVCTPLPYFASQILLVIGAITTLLGGYAAIYENDLKKLIALSTLSQLGVMMFTLGMHLPYLAYFHLLTHASFKAMLFICAGMILMSSYGVQDLRLLGGLGRNLPLISFFFILSNLCLLAFPFLNAYFTKHIILEMMHEYSFNCILMVMFLGGSLFTAIYVIRSCKLLLWTAPSMRIAHLQFSFKHCVPLLVLGLLSVVSGGVMAGSIHEFLYAPQSSSWLWFSIQSLMLVALILILINSNGKQNNRLAATLLFLTPSWNSSGACLAAASSNMKSLDGGWLEPSAVFPTSAHTCGSYINEFFLWPVLRPHTVSLSSSLALSLVFMWLFL